MHVGSCKQCSLVSGVYYDDCDWSVVCACALGLRSAYKRPSFTGLYLGFVMNLFKNVYCRKLGRVKSEVRQKNLA